MGSTHFIHPKTDDCSLVDQSTRIMPIKAPRAGYRTTHLVLNCICLATAALDFYLFCTDGQGICGTESYPGELDEIHHARLIAIYIRIAYLVTFSAFAMASAIVHGVGNVFRLHPNKSYADKPVFEAIYYSINCGLCVILWIVLLLRFHMEMKSRSNYSQNPFMITTLVLTFINAMMYLAAAVNAFMTRRSDQQDLEHI